MLIWSGHGILIIVFAILGAVGGTILSDSIGASKTWQMVLGVWGLALGALFYAMTLGKTREKVLIDPQTRRPVTLKSRHSLFFVPAMGWAVMAILAAISLTGLSIVSPDAAAVSNLPEAPALEESASASEPEPSEPVESLASETTVPISLPHPERIWTSADGRALQASLVEFTPDKRGGVFVRSDGSKFTIERERFSVEDQTLFDQILAATHGGR